MSAPVSEGEVRALYRKTKPQLASLIRRDGLIVWTATPLERWSKDELVNEALRIARRQAGAAR